MINESVFILVLTRTRDTPDINAKMEDYYSGFPAYFDNREIHDKMVA